MEEDDHIGGYMGEEPIVNEEVGLLPSNRALIGLQFTHEEAEEPEIVTELGCLEDIFEHYQPKIEHDYVDEEGGTVSEKMHYRKIKDFTPAGIIGQSDFLQALVWEEEYLGDFLAELAKNKRLQTALGAPAGKQAFLNGLDALIAELTLQV